MSTNFKAKTNLNNYSSQYRNAEQVQCSALYLGMQIPIYLNLKHIQRITTVKQIFQFCLYAIFLGLEFKCVSLCNYNIQTFRFFIDFSLLYLKKLPHAALICFLYFCILIFQSKHSNIIPTLQSTILSSCCAALNW